MSVRRLFRGVAALAVMVLGAVPAAAQGPIRIGEINSFSGIGAPFTGPYRSAVEMTTRASPRKR
jgi:hypothetical protein